MQAEWQIEVQICRGGGGADVEHGGSDGDDVSSLERCWSGRVMSAELAGRRRGD